MNKNSKPLIFLAAAAITVLNFQSCKKYDDGPAFSLRSKKARLTGEWELVKINGQTPEQHNSNDNTTYTNYDLEIEFESDGDLTYSINRSYINYYGSPYGSYSYNGSNSYSLNGEWEWEDNKEAIEITINSPFGNLVVEGEITKLTNNELELELDGEDLEFEKK